ncbi:MAG: hypothetical protein NVSMB62_27700 [Acidobacteriaceae bacterium]
MVAHLSGGLTVQQFTYDVEGRLTQVIGPSGAELLSYDPTGALAIRNQSGNKTIYVGASMTLTVSSTGVASGKLHVLLGGGRVATIPMSGAAVYYHRDRLGSIVATSQAGGVAGAYYRYGFLRCSREDIRRGQRNRFRVGLHGRPQTD